eukprot:scaffold650869_cov42-Prasinocladus_malaysianus.AAC.1
MASDLSEPHECPLFRAGAGEFVPTPQEDGGGADEGVGASLAHHGLHKGRHPPHLDLRVAGLALFL